MKGVTTGGTSCVFSVSETMLTGRLRIRPMLRAMPTGIVVKQKIRMAMIRNPMLMTRLSDERLLARGAMAEAPISRDIHIK